MERGSNEDPSLNSGGTCEPTDGLVGRHWSLAPARRDPRVVERGKRGSLPDSGGMCEPTDGLVVAPLELRWLLDDEEREGDVLEFNMLKYFSQYIPTL